MPRREIHGRRPACSKKSYQSVVWEDCNMLRRIVGTLIVVLLGAAPLLAQQGTTELRGRAADAQGGVLPGVTVTVRNQETGMYRETVSGEDGSVIATGLVPGRYEVVAELQGFKKFNRRDLVLEVGKTATIEVAL